ncbi:MAG TPA: LssY C-terminal domain-containing protein [Propionicimonas sp.]|nr:LssY C-terminal domain-containing protein [Propionicimonas sp.]
MATPPEPHLPRRVLRGIDTLFFVLATVVAAWFAYLLLRQGVTPGWPMLFIIVFWAMVAYLVLPRVHRILTGIYLPDYFIGRTRTADGLLGDPVNLGLIGTEAQIHQAMTVAGWIRADELSLRTGARIVGDTLRRRSYPQAPVSPLFLFRRRQDFAYQQEVSGSPSQRHHVRFWQCPPGWLLPGGYAVDWVAAGTFDRSVGLSLFTLQVTHKIDQDTDVERDHIIDTVRSADPDVAVHVIEGFSAGYHSRNGGGDRIQTDGDLPVLDLTAVSAAPTTEVVTTVRPDGPPAQTVFGVVVATLRGVSYLLLASVFAIVTVIPDLGEPVTELAVLAGFFLVLGLLDFILARATHRGSNWSRMLLSAMSLWSVTVPLVTDPLTGGVHSGYVDLVPLAISVLTLLALSSDPAREFATRSWTEEPGNETVGLAP